MKTTIAMKVRPVRLDNETHEALMAIAEREDRTISDVIRQAIHTYLKAMS